MLVFEQVYSADAAEAASTFPTFVPEPERKVYQAVSEATQSALTLGEGVGLPLPATFNRPPRLSFYATPGIADPEIPVVRGWPAYPGKVPAIGVAVGTDNTNDAEENIAGGFIGEAVSTDASGNVLARADYYSEPIYSQVIVEVIHENRDERDRLHAQLRLLLANLRRNLTGGLIHKVRIDDEKQELPLDEQPYVLYVSLFTVHVFYEMWQAVDVVAADGTITATYPYAFPEKYGPQPATTPAVPPLPPNPPVDPGVTFPFPASP